jgi:acetylornithine/N-succinyldiaminopimelate aminotransferase
MGRCGSLFTWQQYGVKPDIMTTAKALGCGIPVGAFLLQGKAAEHSLVAGDHGSTYGGNPLACAAVSKVLDLYAENNIIEHVTKIAPVLEKALDSLVEKYDFCLERRGLGLMQGLVCAGPVAPVIQKCLDNGLVLINAGSDILRFVPPLIIEESHIREMMGILEDAIRSL